MNEQELGRWIRAKRSHLGISQKELAKRVGIDRYSLLRIESGARRIQWDEAWTIIRELGTSPIPAPPDEPEIPLGPDRIIQHGISL